MTGGQTEKVEVPMYEQVVSGLMEVASTMFLAALNPDKTVRSMIVMEVWSSFRSIISIMLMQQNTILREPDYRRLEECFVFAHEWRHGMLDPVPVSVPSLEFCQCECAFKLRRLDRMIDESV
jgi:hypothetical protein